MENQAKNLKCFKLTGTISIILVVATLGIEIANNAILYATRAQGYGPDTIVEKLLRYLVLTSAINFTMLFLSWWCVKKSKYSDTVKSYVQLLSVSVIVGNVAISHYQFACTLCVVSIPIVLSILYEDQKLNMVVAVTDVVFQIIAIICRATDPTYGVDMVPEAIIAVAFTAFVFCVARMCIHHLVTVRKQLDEAIVAEEEVKYAKALEKKNEELEQYSVSIIEALSKAVDFNEPYTAGHSKRVATYATEIAKRLGYSEEESKKVYYAGLLHDVGKLGIDNSIITKNGKLTEEEYAEIKRHPQMGFEILKDIALQEDYALGAIYHHERVDGKGYPNHNKEIPMIGRIIAVADAYDAMTSRRSYRDVMAQSDVRKQIEGGRGTQFDAQIADIMLQMIDDDKDYKMKQ